VLQIGEFCRAAAAACAAYGAAELAPRITALAATGAQAPFSHDSSAAAKLLQNLARPLVHAFFPTHAALPLVFNLAMVLVGPEELHAPCLLIMKAVFQADNLELGSFGRSAAHVSCLKTLVLLLEGGKSAEVLEGLDVVLDHLTRSAAEPQKGGLSAVAAAGALAARRASDEQDAQQLLADFLPVGEARVACAAVAAALQQCVSATARPTGRASGVWGQRSRFLPFVQ
jgi:hypothetical protein